MMLSGLRSRWTMPSACAAPSARITCDAMCTMRGSGSAPASSSSCRQRPPLEKLHRQEELPAPSVGAEVEHARSCSGARSSRSPSSRGGSAARPLRDAMSRVDQLERHHAVHRQLPRLVDRAHPARAELADDLVTSRDHLPDHESDGSMNLSSPPVLDKACANSPLPSPCCCLRSRSLRRPDLKTPEPRRRRQGRADRRAHQVEVDYHRPAVAAARSGAASCLRPGLARRRQREHHVHRLVGDQGRGASRSPPAPTACTCCRRRTTGPSSSTRVNTAGAASPTTPRRTRCA